MQDALDYILEEIGDFRPEMLLTLGSGLGDFADTQFEHVIRIPYEKIPGLSKATVSGHRGHFVFGVCGGRKLACMQGRLHYYEGYGLDLVTLPVRLVAALGAQACILTNAAGGIHGAFKAGDFMLIEDHINFLGDNPLIGRKPDADEVHFPDMTEVYDREWLAKAETLAKAHPLLFRRGVYLATSGPSFETPAEIRAFKTLGADAVGMSTVPEAIVARQCGMRVLGISFISNLAAGLGSDKLSEEEVFENAARIQKPFTKYLVELLKALD